MVQWEKTGWVECDAEDRIRLKFPVLDKLERAEANRETGVGVKCELRLGGGRVRLTLTVGQRVAGVEPYVPFESTLSPGRAVLVGGRIQLGQ